MRKPRVAMFSTNFLEYSQTFIYEQIRHHRRYDVEVFARNRLNREQFPFYPVHQPGEGQARPVAGIESAIYGMSGLNPAFFLRFLRARFDIIHAHFGPGALYALPYAQALNLPLVVSFYGYDVPALLSRERREPWIIRYRLLSGLLLRRADRMLPVSRDLGDMLVRAGAPADRVKVCYLGTTVPREVPKKSPREGVRVVMVGRFVEKKGFIYGIRAFARARSCGVPMTMTIIGDGPLKAEYEEEIRKLNLEHLVSLPGAMSHKDMLAAVADSDLLMAPSVVAANGDTEGVLTVIKEAAAWQVPTIITRHGGNPEIVEEGVTALIAEERDEEGLGQALATLALDSDLRTRMGQAARARMNRLYTYAASVQTIEDHYDEVISSFQRKRFFR